MMLHSAQPNSVTKVTLNCSNVSMAFDAKMFNFHMLEHTHIPAYLHPCIPTSLHTHIPVLGSINVVHLLGDNVAS